MSVTTNENLDIDMSVPWGIQFTEREEWLVRVSIDASDTRNNPLSSRFLYGLYFLVSVLVLGVCVGGILYGSVIDFHGLLLATLTLLGLPIALGVYLDACRRWFPLVQTVSFCMNPDHLRVERSVFGIPLPVLERKGVEESDWNLKVDEDSLYCKFDLASESWRARSRIWLHLNDRQADWLTHLLTYVL